MIEWSKPQTRPNIKSPRRLKMAFCKSLALASAMMVLNPRINLIECHGSPKRWLTSVDPSTDIGVCTHLPSMSAAESFRSRCSAVTDEYGCDSERNCPKPLMARVLIKANWACWDDGTLNLDPGGEGVDGVTLDECETRCRSVTGCVWF